VSAPIIGGMIAHVPRSTYFSSANTNRCRTFLNDADGRSVVREASGTLRLTHPFLMEALLPAPAARTRAYAAIRLQDAPSFSQRDNE